MMYKMYNPYYKKWFSADTIRLKFLFLGALALLVVFSSSTLSSVASICVQCTRAPPPHS